MKGRKKTRKKARPKKVRYKRACPNCGSRNFGTVGTDLTFLTGSAAQTYRCYNCGYKSRIFPMMSPRELASFKVGAKKPGPVPGPADKAKARPAAKPGFRKEGKSPARKAAALVGGIGLVYFLGIGGFIIAAGSYLAYRRWKGKRK